MIKYAFYQSKLGLLKIGYRSNLITYLSLVKVIDCKNEPDKVSDKAFQEIVEYLEGKRKEFSFSIELCGTNFQNKVWNALLKIPYGETKTYKDVAIAIGNPKASRAVGMANHNNRIIIVVPCHRVIGSNKKLTGYALGLNVKKTLLDLEAKNI